MISLIVTIGLQTIPETKLAFLRIRKALLAAPNVDSHRNPISFSADQSDLIQSTISLKA